MTRHIHNWVSFLLWPSRFILPEAISNCPPCFPVAYWIPSEGGTYLLVSYLFAFSYHSWGSPGRNSGVGCHFFLQCTIFCQNSSLWSIYLGWPCMAWLIASLSCANCFVKTRLWSMKELNKTITTWLNCHCLCCEIYYINIILMQEKLSYGITLFYYSVLSHRIFCVLK